MLRAGRAALGLALGVEAASLPKSLGSVSSLGGRCFESEGGGFIGSAPEGAVVWDIDAPCGPGKAYIHAAPGAECAPMTAGAGPLVHRYISAEVADADGFAGLVGSCGRLPEAAGPETTWKVADARRGGACAEEALTALGSLGRLLTRSAKERIRSCTLKGYTSGALPVQLLNWTPDEGQCLELVPGVGVVVHEGSLKKPTDPEDDEQVIPEPNVGNFLIAPGKEPWVAVYVPQGSMVARVSLYNLSKPSKLVMELNLPKKVKDCQMLWNFDGTALLANAGGSQDGHHPNWAILCGARNPIRKKPVASQLNAMPSSEPAQKASTHMQDGHDTVDRDTVFANYKSHGHTERSVFSLQFAVSLMVEFIGTMFFQILGGSAAKDMGAFVNAFALAVWIYVAANISGGHLNPAVSFSTCVCGFYPLLHTIVYVCLQVCGAICGAWALSGLVPGASAGMGDGGPGCFDSTVVSSELTRTQVFWWECLMTFTLISCVYACGVAKPGHGSHTPLAVGLSLFACAASGGQYTGGALNPARVLGPRVIFKCGEGWAGLYVGAQMLAAVFAMSVFAFVSGLGPLNPRVAKSALGLSWPEAMFLWITGSPPSRLQVTGKENISDFHHQIKNYHRDRNMPSEDKKSNGGVASWLEGLLGVKQFKHLEAMSDVDESGNSYFGSTYLYWLKPDERKKMEVCGVDKGLVQDLAWSPCSNEFMVIVGMLPAAMNLYSGATGKLEKSLGQSKRNTLKWNPFGRFVAVAGFGTLPGDLDFYDRSKDETVASLRAALTVDCSWFGDGRHFMAATVAPRMNEGNQITVYKYTGEAILKIDFKPDFVAARHEDTGAGARTKTQALLFAARWRPSIGKHEDRAASPPRDGEKRVKGLPTALAPGSGHVPLTNAYRPRNAEGGGAGTVAAMMRGEVAIPEGPQRERTEPWETKPVAPALEEWEIKKLEKEAKKLAEQREKEAKEKHQQALRDVVQNEKDTKKRIKELKQMLEELEKLKEKDWDELTEEDEVELDREAALRAELTALEQKG
ncbi:unnamed protein product [Effrenium voratum]|uniref:Translation initiation factor beta propellor-like domain-containing protein n=1 Tax=Effrenium voratum TaxID=2562239 RepID=A0AA36NEU4_9DINO|nr:unnamed protein product [Effrenium voratum]